jgi:hypothetical protein
MNYRLLIGVALAAAPLSAVAAMPVSTFLGKAAGLKRKGPLAMFSGDLKLLMNQVKRDAGELMAENKAAAAAGKPKAYCTPPGGVEMGTKDVMAAMQSVPAAQRARTSTKQALSAYFARRFPCKG